MELQLEEPISAVTLPNAHATPSSPPIHKEEDRRLPGESAIFFSISAVHFHRLDDPYHGL